MIKKGDSASVLAGSILSLLVCVSLCCPGTSLAQVQRLPPVAPDRLTTSSITTTPVSYPHELSESPTFPQDASDHTPLSTSKPGVLQRVALTTSWMGRGGAGGLGIAETELYATFGFPFPTRDSPLLITPGYEVRFLDGPSTTDLPSRLHDAYVSFRWMRKIGDRWGVDVAVSPGVHSDFDQWNGEALRITGHGIVSLDTTPTTKWVLGVVYLDRDDVNMLPAAGLIWTPSPDHRYELLFPRPKLAWRWNCGESFEDWFYVAGEFGGGSWSVQRTSGVSDVVTLRDWRAVLGVQRKRDGGGDLRVEAAWVFSREVEYASGVGDFQPDSALMLRCAIAY